MLSSLKMILGLLCYSAAIIISAPANAQTNVLTRHDMFADPTGLWIVPSKKGPNQVENKLYGPTSPAANWTVSQWDIPEDLPSFSNNSSQNQYASVLLNSDNSFRIMQNASLLPCQKIFPSGKQLPDEFDLFLGPVSQAFPKYKQAFLGRRQPLSQLSHAFLNATLQPTLLHLSSADCPVTRAIAGVGVVLTNTATRQTFFYQLNFALYQANGHEMAAKLLQPGWFFTGTNTQAGKAKQFGYGDRVWSSFGVSPAPVNTATSFNLNLLPRIEQLLSEGSKYGMDQNLSNWAITGEYYGQSVFGHVEFGSKWSGLSLKTD
jgi:hypothetical protein